MLLNRREGERRDVSDILHETRFIHFTAELLGFMGEQLSGQDSELKNFAAVAAGDGMGFKKIPPWGEKVDRIFVFLEYVSITCLLWTALCPPQIHMLKS